MVKADKPQKEPSAGASQSDAFERIGEFAKMTKTLPVLNRLEGISLTYAVRWLLWLSVVVGSLAGIFAAVAGTALAVWAFGPLASSANGMLTYASTSTLGASGGLESATLAVANISTTSSMASDSLSNLSDGLGKMATGIDALSALPAQSGGGADWSGSATSIRSSSVGLQETARLSRDSSKAAGETADKLAGVSSDMRKLSAEFSAAKNKVNTAMFYTQLAVLLIGGSLAIMLSCVFALALAVGPPRVE